MTEGPVRRAQLIVPFGIGSMLVTRDGVCVITAGLDHWFKEEGERSVNPTVEEFTVEEWRLQRRLKVNHFRLPPDYRIRSRYSRDVPNMNLTIPFLRFPRWHYCPHPGCRTLQELDLITQGKQRCEKCKSKLVQVQFVAMCESGHIQDFPIREWVHKKIHTDCKLPMRLLSTGGASLAAQVIVCECGARRTLANITGSNRDGSTTLSSELEKGKFYGCNGMRPWLGSLETSKCGLPLRGSLRSAANVYFSRIHSAIYLPPGIGKENPKLRYLLSQPPYSTVIEVLSDCGMEIPPKKLRERDPLPLEDYSDSQIESAIKNMGHDSRLSDPGVAGDDEETAFRRVECYNLRREICEPELVIRTVQISKYTKAIAAVFAGVSLVEKLRETRVLSGFSRIYPEFKQDLHDMKALLWNHVPKNEYSWLPAYIVFGEGIYLELDEKRLRAWERLDVVIARARMLQRNYDAVARQRHWNERIVSPRFVLLHTFAHLLINQLTFECGYSSASLRERIYVSTADSSPMAGILIYTAAGDSEGSMGGLVRMGAPDFLEPMVGRAIQQSKWCSADPVCLEMGQQGGQGPDSLNLAACHSCALLPETACEVFNILLDRGLVIGEPSQPELGFFSNYGESE